MHDRDDPTSRFGVVEHSILSKSRQKYSEDRESLAQEIREGLKARGFYAPDNAGSNMINAVFMAIDGLQKRIFELTQIRQSLEKDLTNRQRRNNASSDAG